MNEEIIGSIAVKLGVKQSQVKSALELLEQGNTIPFIARYRKEKTGQMNDIVLRDFYDRLNYLRNLETRKEEIIRLIDEQGKLTDELTTAIFIAKTLTELEKLDKESKRIAENEAKVNPDFDIDAAIEREEEIKKKIENGELTKEWRSGYSNISLSGKKLWRW